MLALYLLEAGLLLVIAPWSGLWNRNYFTLLWPWMAELMGNPFMRGAVTGIGVVSVLAAVAEVMALVGGASGSSSLSDQGA